MVANINLQIDWIQNIWKISEARLFHRLLSLQFLNEEEVPLKMRCRFSYYGPQEAQWRRQLWVLGAVRMTSGFASYKQTIGTELVLPPYDKFH